VTAVKKLTTRYRPLLDDGAMCQALSMAARQGHASLVTLLLDAGADPHSADAEGWTPLRAAAWGGHNDTVEILLKRGAQVDACDAEGRTALRAAAWAGHEEVVKTLLASGAGVDGQDRQGRTPLIAAAYMGHADIVAALLDAGAEPDHADCEGRTALSVAVLNVTCRSANQSEAPVNRSRRNRSASTGSVRTRRRPSAPRADQLQSHPADEEEGDAVETISILLEYGATVDHQDKEGMTPLLVAAFEGHRCCHL
jgi:ankyrin repeat domain-containing protein 50